MGRLDETDSALLGRVQEWQELQERLLEPDASDAKPTGEPSDAGLVDYVPTHEALEELERQRDEVRKELLATVDA